MSSKLLATEPTAILYRYCLREFLQLQALKEKQTSPTPNSQSKVLEIQRDLDFGSDWVHNVQQSIQSSYEAAVVGSIRAKVHVLRNEDQTADGRLSGEDRVPNHLDTLFQTLKDIWVAYNYLINLTESIFAHDTAKKGHESKGDYDPSMSESTLRGGIQANQKNLRRLVCEEIPRLKQKAEENEWIKVQPLDEETLMDYDFLAFSK